MAILNYTDDELANMIATATARTEVAYPLDNTDYVASDAQVWHSTRSHGIFSADSELLVNASGGMNVTLGIGRAFLKPDIFLCCVYANKQDKVLPIDRADGTLNRIDRLVIRWDFMTETVTAQIKKGTLAMTPKPPSLQRDANAWELARADIMVKAGVLEITQADIKDLSGDETLCGVMRDDVTKIPTEQLYLEYNAWFNALKTDSQKEFIEWFDSIKDILDENTAGTLLNMINANTQRLDSLLPVTGKIDTTGWTSTTEHGYSYYKNFTVTGITANDSIDIRLTPSALVIANKAGMAGACETYNGYVRIYSKKIPTASMDCIYIVNKGVA